MVPAHGTCPGTWWRLALILLTLINGNVSENNTFVSKDNGRVIISHNVAFVFQGSALSVKRKVSAIQPFQLQPLKDLVQKFQKLAAATPQACLQQDDAAPPPHLGEDESDVPFGPLKGAFRADGFILLREEPATPERVRALCRNNGLLMPDVTDPQARHGLQKFLVQAQIPAALVDHAFSDQQHLVFSPATGIPLFKALGSDLDESLRRPLSYPQGIWLFTQDGKLAFSNLHAEQNLEKKESDWKRIPPICQLGGSLRQRLLASAAQSSKERAHRERTTLVKLKKTCLEVSNDFILRARFMAKRLDSTVQKTGIQQLGNRRKRLVPQAALMGLSYIGKTALTLGAAYQAYQRDLAFEDQLELFGGELQGHAAQLQALRSVQAGQEQLIEDLLKQVDRVGKVVEVLGEQAATIATLFELEQRVSTIEAKVLREIDALDDFLQEVSAGQVPLIVQSVARLAAAQGLTGTRGLVADQAKPATILGRNAKDELLVLFRFLILDEAFDIYKAYALPIYVSGSMQAMRIRAPFLALDRELRYYIELESDQVTQCLQGPCDLVGVRRAVGESPCHARAIIGLKPEGTCPYDVAPPEPYFRTTPSGIVYSVHEPLVTHVTCDWNPKPGPEGQATLTGYGIIELPPGCTLHSTRPDFKFRGPPATTNVTLRHVQISALSDYRAELLNESFSGFELPPTALRLWTRTKQQLQETNLHVAAMKYAAIAAFSILLLLLTGITFVALRKACQAYKYVQVLKGRLLATVREVVGHSAGPITRLLCVPAELRRRLRAFPLPGRQRGLTEVVARAIQEQSQTPPPRFAPTAPRFQSEQGTCHSEAKPATHDPNSNPATVNVSSEAQRASVRFRFSTEEDPDYIPVTGPTQP